MPEYGFRQLDVWRVATELHVAVARLSRRLPADERFELALQMRRAAASIPANIAEGNGRAFRREYLHFLSIARGSLMELDNHIEQALRLGYLSAADAGAAIDLLARTRQLLTRLMQALRRPSMPARPQPSTPHSLPDTAHRPSRTAPRDPGTT